MVRSQQIIDVFQRQGVTHAVGLTDNIQRTLFLALEGDPRIRLVTVCREGEAFGVAAGLWVGGARPVVLLQNTGFLEAGDALRGTAINMAVPLVMLIGFRGRRSLAPGAGRVDTAATFLEPTLRAWGVAYDTLAGPEDLPLLERAFAASERESRPRALLIPEALE
ncbi:MAG: hypothetical protein HY321_10675 [Armatimonadetes bacterium]|nr:hypothetical protein [Armatimonadota bacterium]